MACRIDRPTPQVLFNRLRDMFSVTVLGGSPVIPESNEWYVVSTDYAVAETFYAYSDQLLKELDPATACCENLIAMAAQNGVYPRPAGFAEGYGILTGTPNSPIPSRIEIVASGGNYISVGTVPPFIGTDGTATVHFRALIPGTGQQSGQVSTATLFTPIANVDSQVTIAGGTFCGGTDAEDCESFRTRYLDRLAYHPRATQEWIQQKFLEYPCVTRVCVRAGSCCECQKDCPQASDCSCKNCGGNLEYYVMMDNAFPCGIPPPNIIADINTWMFGEHPGYGEGQVEIGVCGAVFNCTAIMVNTNIDIVGCPTVSQMNAIRQGITDYFGALCPSQPAKTMAIRLIIANIIGIDIDTDVQFTLVDPTQAQFVTHSLCGDLEPMCDYLLCLNTTLAAPPSYTTTTGCA